MKKELKFKSDDINKFRLQVERPISEVYEEINTSCNDFLKTQKGLQYLMLKYPKLSPQDAVREYYSQVYIAENYNG